MTINAIMETEPQQSQSALQPGPQLLRPLPEIPYDRNELDEIIDRLHLTADKKDKLTNYLITIENQVADIQDYKATKHTRNFYEAMRVAILEIRNIAQEIYELTHVYHSVLANTLKQLLLNWVEPLDNELNRRKIPAEYIEQLEFKTKRLYAQQSFFARQKPFGDALIELLYKLKHLLIEPGKPQPRCYISYSWPNEDNEREEYWVQPFLCLLYDHLKAAGIKMIMDIRDHQPGDDIYQVIRHYRDGNHIVLIGTQSLLHNHYSISAHTMKTELNIISERFETDRNRFGHGRIYPLLISGAKETAYPEIYDKYRTVRDGRELGYLLMLRDLIDWLYAGRIEKIEQEYLLLWLRFDKSYQGLAMDADISRIEQEIMFGYHRKQLDYLIQDLKYQSVKYQQIVAHGTQFAGRALTLNYNGQYSVSENFATSDAYILPYETGQQFQRPEPNPDYIERQALWNNMTEYFGVSGQQILTLTIHGLGGIGKTELAGHYYLHSPRQYKLRAWFRAKNKRQLYTQYINLGNTNSLKFVKDMRIDEQVKQVLRWLEEQQDCLLVYDNVVNFKEIEELLPQRGKHHILITSRNEIDWPVHQRLGVDVMEEKEAIDLIVKMTGYNRDKNQADLKELVSDSVLGRLPLALAQAGAYMAAKSMGVREYLVLCQLHQVTLLSGKNVRTPKHEPIWITFDMNFKALQKECPSALATMKRASWLNAYSIPERLLSSMLEVENDSTDRRLLWADVKEHIKRYSLMRSDAEQNIMSIHPLLQDILRSKNEYNTVIDAIHEEFWLKMQPLEDKNRQRSLLPHLQTLELNYQKYAKDLDSISDLALSKILLDIGYVLYDQLGLMEAKIYLESALRIKKQHSDEDDIEIATILTYLGSVYRDLGDAEESKKLLEQALEIYEQYYGKDHIDVASVLTRLANALRHLGNAKEASVLLKRALKIYTQSKVDTDNFGIATTLTSLGVIYTILGNFVEAKRLLVRASRINEQHYGKDHFETAITLTRLGDVCRQLGNAAEAKVLLVRALNIKKQHYGESHFLTAVTLDFLGAAYRELGKNEEARSLLEQALAINEKHYGLNHSQVAFTLTHLGDVYRSLESFQESMDYLNRALKIQEEYYGPLHLETGIVMFSLVKTHLMLKELGAARSLAKKCHAIFLAEYTEKHPRTKEISLLLRRLL